MKACLPSNQCTVPENTKLMGLTLNIDGCSGSHIKNHLDESSKYDWTVFKSLCGLVVWALTQNVRGVRFDPHWVVYTFQSYCVVRCSKELMHIYFQLPTAVTLNFWIIPSNPQTQGSTMTLICPDNAISTVYLQCNPSTY